VVVPVLEVGDLLMPLEQPVLEVDMDHVDGVDDVVLDTFLIIIIILIIILTITRVQQITELALVKMAKLL
jgi:hypothetical protein